jgi:hypothetical protein
MHPVPPPKKAVYIKTPITKDSPPVLNEKVITSHGDSNYKPLAPVYGTFSPLDI